MSFDNKLEIRKENPSCTKYSFPYETSGRSYIVETIDI